MRTAGGKGKGRAARTAGNGRVDLPGLLARLSRLAAKAESVLDAAAPPVPAVDEASLASPRAFRWRPGGGIVPVAHPHRVALSDLVGVDAAKELLLRNTEGFVAGRPANDVLIWGERGNGKSSLVKGLLPVFGDRGLRLVEVRRWDLLHFPEIVAALRERPYRFVLFCDDLSFDDSELGFRELKTLLDGGIEERPGNVLIYATSNRRHLMPEIAEGAPGRGEEIHPEEAVSEKLALSDRFGLSVGIYPFDQETYLAAVRRHAARAGLRIPARRLREAALRWALATGRRSGRSAKQVVDDAAGRQNGPAPGRK